MDCKEKVKQKKSAGKEENCKICVKRQRSFGKEDFYENEVKRQQNSGKAKLGKAAAKCGAMAKNHKGRTTCNASECEQLRQAPEGKKRATILASVCEQVVPEGKTTIAMRGGSTMVEQKKNRQMAAENSIPRGKAQKAASERRKGYFYLWLAVWWPTTKGCRRWARKGVERRLRAFEESQNCAVKV